MPKTLILIRHAKSSWKDPDLQDSERPLNNRGRRNAPFMGQILANKKIRIERVCSSHARRAMDTAQHICDEISYPQADIEKDQALYHAPAQQLLNYVRSLDDQLDCVALVGHNPGLNELTNLLTSDHIENIPTCGIVVFELNISSWTQAGTAKTSIASFDFPKKYL